MALLPLAPRLSLSTLIFWPLLANTAALASAIALAAATGASGAAVMSVTLPAIGLTGATTACLQAGTFALASHFPSCHMQAGGLSAGCLHCGDCLLTVLRILIVLA